MYMEEYNFLRFFTFVRATLALVIPRNWGFAVTPKTLASSTRVPIRLWPQFAIAVAAVASIPLAVMRYSQNPYLPLGAFLANLVWVGLTAAIGIKALRFATNRLDQRRSEHRFSIPFIAAIEGSDGPRRLIAENISSNGFRISGSSLASLPDVLQGELLLPGGRLPFKAQVIARSASKRGEHSLAARFLWTSPAQSDALNACLYGNTLQWDVNDWAEVRSRRWAGFFRSNHRAIARAQSWSFVEVLCGPTRLEAIAKREGTLIRILATEPMPSLGELQLQWGPRSVIPNLNVIGLRSYPMGAGALYMGVLAEAGTAAGARFHREPAWYSQTDQEISPATTPLANAA